MKLRLVAVVVAVALALVAAAPAASADPDADWLETVNFVRWSAGLAPVVEEPSWSQGNREHARYMVEHNVIGHSQDPSARAATEEGAAAAAASNVLGDYSADTTAVDAVHRWTASAFHAIGMLRPELTATGYGAYRSPRSTGLRMGAGLDVIRGLDGPALVEDRYPVLWPGDGASTPVSSGSNPGDIGCPGHSTVGAPIFARYAPGTKPRVTSSRISGPSGAVTHCAVDGGSYVNDDPDRAWRGDVLERESIVLLSPLAPLERGVYDVRIELADGTTTAWSFRVAGASSIPGHPRSGQRLPQPVGWPEVAAVSADALTHHRVEVRWSDAEGDHRGYQVLADGAPVAAAEGPSASLYGLDEGDHDLTVRAEGDHGFLLDGPSTTVRVPAAPRLSEGRLERLAGANRVATAVKVAGETHPDGAATVLLARADDYADALAAAPLAAAVDAPILLTDSSALDDVVAKELDRLDATSVILLGGQAALSAEVAGAIDVHVERIAGADRFATAVAIAERLPNSEGRVYLAEAFGGWADAVTVAGLAAFEGAALLPTTAEALPAATRDYLAGSDTAQATLVGGTAVLDRSLEAELGHLGLDVDRVAGRDRYATGRQVRNRSLAAGLTPDEVWVATARNWPDSLVVGAAAGARGGLLALVDGREPRTEPSDIASYAEDHSTAITRMRVVGGDAVISEALFEDLRWALR